MSQVRANEIADAAGTGPANLLKQWAAKSWLNFNGTGTIAVRKSGNVSGMLDVGTGQYEVNFVSAFTGLDYSPVTGGRVAGATTVTHANLENASASKVSYVSAALNGTIADILHGAMTVTGDLA